MNYFVIQVKTRGETKYIKIAKTLFKSRNLPEEVTGRLLWPRRKITIRKRGKSVETLAPIYPGYIFLEAEDISTEVYWLLKRVVGFYRFLKNNQEIEPLGENDKRILLHFLSFGDVVEKSLVTFDENQKIQVVNGPMKGLEGRIVKVDKRKKRAKIMLSLYENAFLVDFGFDVLEQVEQGDEEKS